MRHALTAKASALFVFKPMFLTPAWGGAHTAARLLEAFLMVDDN